MTVSNNPMPAALHLVRSAEKAAVLMQPGRLELLRSLEQPASAASLARQLGVPRQKLNYHLRELEREGFVEFVEERRKGNCMERIVQATAQTFLIAPQATGPLGETHAEIRDRFSASYLIATAARIIRELAGLAARARKAQKRVATLTLETEIRFASAASRDAFTEELTAAIGSLTAKYHDGNSSEGRTFRLIAASYPLSSRATETSDESVNVD